MGNERADMLAKTALRDTEMNLYLQYGIHHYYHRDYKQAVAELMERRQEGESILQNARIK